MDYSQTSPADQPLIPFTLKYEVKKWYTRIFEATVSKELYFQDGVSNPIVQYGVVKSSTTSTTRPIAARSPYPVEVVQSNFWAHLRTTSVLLYNGIGTTSRKGINYLTLMSRPLLSFDPTPYFRGNTYLHSLSEGSKGKASKNSLHVQTSDKIWMVQKGELRVQYTLILPDQQSWDDLFDAIIDDVSRNTIDDTALRLYWVVGYLLQPFELVQLALDSVARQMWEKSFVEWCKTASKGELSNTTSYAEEVVSRCSWFFESLYGIDNSEHGDFNRVHLEYMVSFIRRMLATNENRNQPK